MRKMNFTREQQNRLIIYITGLIALGWFLIRVIPKPSRAYYPCMKAAFPFASAFVIYLLSVTSSWVAFRHFKKALRNNKFIIASALIILTVLAFFSSMFIINEESVANTVYFKSHAINEPIGVPVGIYPGRVVWVWDRFATRKECTNTVNKNGILDNGDDVWFQDKNTDQLLVTQMISTGIQELTGKPTDNEAWDEIFRFHNHTRGKGNTGYTRGEKILLKLNRTSTNAATNLNVNTMRRNDKYGRTALSETSPQIVLAVLRHLVHKAGVPQDAIYVGDLQRNHYQEEYEKYTEEFPMVNYLGTNIYHNNVRILDNGRTPVVRSESPLLFYSDNGEIMTDAGGEEHLYTIFEEIEYMINLPMMKGHATGGVTIFPKNHYGSQARESAAHLHGGLVNGREGYGKYRVLVDIMGSEYLGIKNLVYILDALWPGPDWGDQPVKFRMDPFNDDWTSSVFFSFDPVAIESVAYDFLRTEFDGNNAYTDKAFPNMHGADDYLHQAASESNWPAGITYTPNGDGVKIPSLGVHEHWNNADDKKYSVNLGTGNGIELIPMLVENHAPYQVKEFETFTVTMMNEEIILVHHLNDYFVDYENDPITFSVVSTTENAVLSVSGTSLVITITGNVPENFTVNLKASDGQASYTTLMNINYSEVNSAGRLNRKGFKIYPNPVRDFINIQYDNDIQGGGDIKIFDLSGKLVYYKSLHDSGPVENSFDLSKLKASTYILEIVIGDLKERILIYKQ
jgi:hypothetical protein